MNPSLSQRQVINGFVACLTFIVLQGIMALVIGGDLMAEDKPPLADDTAKGKKVEFEVHDGYFEKNDLGLKGESPSYLVFTDRTAFDQVFGIACLMFTQNNFVAEDAFDKKMVVTVMKRGVLRGEGLLEYKVNGVTADGDKLFVQYNTKGMLDTPAYKGPAATNNEPATFAVPLIVSVAKNDYKFVVYIENGKNVDTVEVGKKHQRK